MTTELTTTQEKGLMLQQAVKQIILKASNLNKNAFDVAREIVMIKEKGLWKFDDITQPYKNFEHWYEYSGIPVKLETVRQWIRIYKGLIEEMGYTTDQLADIDFWKLRLVCQVVKQNREKVPEVMEQAKVLSYRDLALAIKQMGMNIGVCEHPDVEEITIYKCTTCGQTMRTRPKQ